VMANRAEDSNIEREIASLERALRDAVKQADTVSAALDDLEGHRNELAGRLAIARRAAQDYEVRLEERREALTRALEAEAQARLQESVEARDEAANRAAEAVTQLIDSFNGLNTARDELAEVVTETEAKLGRRVDVGAEPERLESEWARLVDFVRKRAKLDLEDELIEAAVSDPVGFKITKLPEHLQVIARQRRRDRIRLQGGAEPD
jgi:chromosome segregation ATPase